MLSVGRVQSQPQLERVNAEPAVQKQTSPQSGLTQTQVAEQGSARLRDMAQEPQSKLHLAKTSVTDTDTDGLNNGKGKGTDSTSSSSGTTTSRTLKPEDMDRILNDYQVEDDEMVEWELTGWKRTLAELAGKDIPDPVKITKTEAGMLDGLGPFGLQSFNNNKNKAVEETSARYGDANGKDPHPGQAAFNDDHADAFRHAYLNALTARDQGQAWATDYWTAHERVPGNDPAREAMDLHNNEVGRRIAAENPGASDEELADLVEKAVANGEMVVIDKNGDLVPSNAITPDQAGHPDPADQPLPGHPQEKQTS